MKRIIVFFFFFVQLNSSFCQNSVSLLVKEQNSEDSVKLINSPTLEFKAQDSVLNQAFSYQGVPYKIGGMSQQGMDCSGLICKSFGALNLKLPHSSGELSKLGNYVEADSLQVGDLIFFKGRSMNTPSVGHVAMVSKLSNGFIYIIHATNSKGVIEEILQKNSYFMDRWLFNKRIIE
ncbi:MAG: C40 family peptidase [Bacteroidetes bacterium]|nr:C40 family peptidase [Bacteroidota bacterium]